jgi:hypothetical protein
MGSFQNKINLRKDKFNRSVSLLSWAYNEEDSIWEFLEKATQLMDFAVEDYAFVLIDDASTAGLAVSFLAA